MSIINKSNSDSRVMKKLLKKTYKEAKQRYFDQIFTAYQSDIKKTWKTMNKTLNRNKKNSNVASILYYIGNVDIFTWYKRQCI